MKKITIKNARGTGTLILAADGKWDIVMNGKSGGSLHYTQDQVVNIVAKARAEGAEITEE